jgi:DNA-binding NarL/FixJ family response regulator
MEKLSILIVDDEESIRVSLEGILKKKYYAKTADSGSMALEMLQNDCYDLILTDIMMSGMTGIELLKKVKESFPEIPVLLMTGYSSLSTSIEAMRLGASDYLIKPYSKKVIFSSITRCLENNTNGRKKNSTQHLQTKMNTFRGKKPLTKRELEIYNHLTSGMSDKSMAEELFVTLPTVKFHLQNIYRKLGINGRKGILKIISDNMG